MKMMREKHEIEAAILKILDDILVKRKKYGAKPYRRNYAAIRERIVIDTFKWVLGEKDKLPTEDY